MNHAEWNQTRNDPLIRQLLKTIEDNHTFKPTQQKKHITRDQLRQIRASLNLSDPDSLLFWTIALVVGELPPKSHQDTTRVPTIQALRFEKTGMQQSSCPGQRIIR
ncbi:36803_t:CDS:1 [Racocetra persica]|uniref:36803_t:CDS:1 n=1 Tax=Racocetra persica TaxID=160502 RepID=A0ACA9KBZ7_9GLOM|nr:36803_t:CDS:1 [Racocetra persica]